jgi:hypothetical protein
VNLHLKGELNGVHFDGANFPLSDYRALKCDMGFSF